MAKQIDLAAFTQGTLHADDVARVARLVAILHTGKDPETGMGQAEFIHGDARPGFSTRPVTEGVYPLTSNPDLVRDPKGRYVNHRFIRVRTDKSACTVGPFYAAKGKGFASVLDPAKQIIGIVADSDAGNNDANTDAQAARLATKAKAIELNGGQPLPKRKGGRKGNKPAETAPAESGEAKSE